MSLQALTAHLQAAGRLPSIVTGVLRDAALVETAAVNTSPATAFRIGSITKTLTAVLVLQLRDEGRLALDDPIGRVIPETGYAATTLGDLLGHTGGMQSEPAGPWWERSTGGDIATLLAANDGSGAVAPAGAYFHYSNLGYALLGELVARERDAPWWDVAVERLLEPLAMHRTTYAPVAPHAQGCSVEHFTGRVLPEPHTDTGAMAPAGQAWSTVEDLARWAAVLCGRRPEILARESVQEMAAARLDPGYGLGLRRVQEGGTTYVGHTGSMPGFQAGLFVDPAGGDGVVALTNATTGLLPDELPALLRSGPDPDPLAVWEPTAVVPDAVAGLLGVWFWGNTAIELRWNHALLEERALQSGRLLSTFALEPDGDSRGPATLRGRSGYHRGERLRVHPTHLECATFIYTRRPYDPRAPIPQPGPLSDGAAGPDAS